LGETVRGLVETGTTGKTERELVETGKTVSVVAAIDSDTEDTEGEETGLLTGDIAGEGTGLDAAITTAGSGAALTAAGSGAGDKTGQTGTSRILARLDK
jgi:hypothetical protein